MTKVRHRTLSRAYGMHESQYTVQAALHAIRSLCTDCIVHMTPAIWTRNKQVAHTSHDASEVIPHVAEIQVILCHSKVCLKGSYLLSQYQKLLDGEELCIHHAALLGYLSACSLDSNSLCQCMTQTSRC